MGGFPRRPRSVFCRHSLRSFRASLLVTGSVTQTTSRAEVTLRNRRRPARRGGNGSSPSQDALALQVKCSKRDPPPTEATDSLELHQPAAERGDHLGAESANPPPPKGNFAMSIIDLESVSDHTLYDTYVSELRSRVRASRPLALEPERFNEKSLARIAKLMVAGVFARKDIHVIGSDEWVGENPPDLSELPTDTPHFASLHADGMGHTEVFRGYKLGFLLCASPDCGKDFVVKRPASLMARWPTACSDGCRATIRKAQARERYQRRKRNRAS